MTDAELQDAWLRLRKRLAIARLGMFLVGAPLLLAGLAGTPVLGYAGGIVLVVCGIALLVLNRCPACHRPLHEGLTARDGNILRNPPNCPHCGLALP